MNLLLEQRDLNHQAYKELVKAVEDIREKFQNSQSDNYPTAQWVAGKFQQLSYLPSIERSLNSGSVTSPEKQEEYEKFIALKDISLKYNFIKQDGSNYSKTDKGSKFVQSLAKSFSSWKDIATTFKTANEEENNDWIKTLSDEQKQYLEIYKQITSKQYAYLIGLVEKQQSKTNYTDTVATSDENDSEILSHLQNLGLINSDYSLNNDVVKGMLEFLNDNTYARLKLFNNDITYIAKRISADRALLQNILHRNLDKTSFRRTSVAKNADEMVDSLNAVDKTIVKKAYDRVRLTKIETERLKELGILDADSTFTNIGKITALMLTKGDSLDSLQQRGEKPTQYSRLNKSDIESGENKSSRTADKTRTRNISFKNFLATK